MAPKSKYLFIASMDVDSAKEDLFNEVYNNEHCPELSKVSGVGAITRFEAQAFQVLIGGTDPDSFAGRAAPFSCHVRDREPGSP